MPTMTSRSPAYVILLAVSFVLAAPACTIGTSRPVDSVRVFRLNSPDQPATTTPDDHGCQIAISHDGMMAVYPDGISKLMIRRLDDPTPRLLVDHWGARDAFFSENGKWVGYFAGLQLFRAPVAGGAAETLISSLPGHAKGGCWTSEGIIYSPESNAGLWILPLDSLTPRPLTEPEKSAGELSHRWPDVLPDGRGVLFTIKTKDLSDFNSAKIAVLDRRTGKRKTLIDGGTCARYMPTGHIVWARAGKLYAAPFDLASYSLQKDNTAVVCDDVRTQNESGAAMFGFSDDGTLIYMVGSATESRRELVWIDRNNDIRPALEESRAFFGELSMSHDRRYVAIPSAGANDSIWVFDIEEANMRRVTVDGNCGSPAWSTDGSELWFLSDRAGGCKLFAKRLDGGAAREVLPEIDFGTGFGPRLNRSADGRWLAVARGGDIVTIDTKGAGAQRNVAAVVEENASQPVISPDSRLVAYSSGASGSTSIFVRAIDGSGDRHLIARSGGFGGPAQFHWSADGKKLFYLNEGSIFEVAIGRTPELSAGRPQKILEAEDATGFCADASGDLFLVCRRVPQRTKWEVRVVLNWFSRVRALCR